jgi:hypothetical protein
VWWLDTVVDASEYLNAIEITRGSPRKMSIYSKCL